MECQTKDWNLTSINFESTLDVSSNCMAEIIEKGKSVVMKFHAMPKKFKRVMKLSHSKWHYKLYIDKNDSIWDIRECEVLSWKTIEKGHKKVNVPDQVVEKRDVELFNRVKGNPTKVAIDKIVGELDYRLMVELENKD